MASDDTNQEYEADDPMAGAVEHDGTKDAFEEFSEEVDHALGLDEEGEPMPGDRAAGDAAMP